MFLVFGCASHFPPEVRKDARTILSGSYSDAKKTWRRLYNTGIFYEGQSRKDIVALMGRPALAISSGGVDSIFYNSAGGVLDFEFSQTGMIGTHLASTPPRWRGTNQEAEELWNQTRKKVKWYEW